MPFCSLCPAKYFLKLPEMCVCSCVCALQVKEELLVEALTKRKTVTVNDKLILPYSHSEVQQIILILPYYTVHKNQYAITGMMSKYSVGM